MNCKRGLLGMALLLTVIASGGAAARTPMLLANLETLPLPSLPEVRERAPVNKSTRAYAIDGTSFFFDGRRIILHGEDARRPERATRHAAQRLQQALDSGTVSVRPVGEDASGAILALVTIEGRDVREMLP